MIKFVTFSRKSRVLTTLDRTKVRVQVVGELEHDQDIKFAIVQSDDSAFVLPEEMTVPTVFPQRVMPCLPSPCAGKYLSKPDIINNRYSLNDQIKLVRKMAAGDPAAEAAFVEFNEFCEAIP